jgi:hypothetical protein
VGHALKTPALQYAIRRVRLNQNGLKLNGTHGVYALGGRVLTVKEITEALVVGSKETGLDVNARKPKCIGHFL